MTLPVSALDIAASAPMRAQVESWSAVNSGSRNLDGLAVVADLLANAYAVLPGDVRLLDATPGETVDAEGIVQPVVFGRNLHVCVRPSAPVQLLLTGHMDTVFGIDHPFQTVVPLENGAILNGPGCADMKGGIALMLAALIGVEASPLASRIGYEVVINSDEEIGSPGSASLIADAARGKLAALTYEPALPDGTLAGARPGSGNFSIIITGRAAHAGRNPEDGRNAVVAAADLALRLSRARRQGLAINPAKIDGGGPNNIVPDRAILRVNLRPALPGDQAIAVALIDRLIAEVAAEHEVSIHLHGGFGRPPKPVDARAEKLFTLVERSATDLGIAIGRKATGGVCDGNNIAACGVPVVDTMGARGGAIHSIDEYLIVDSLAERARLSTLVMLRLAESGL
ncbi:hydrolase [Sphingomonas montanisoli]|nr:hydrolase [Sphingomonas montanisoli]